MYSVTWLPRALRQLEGLQEKDRRRIVAKLYASLEDPLRVFEKMVNSPYHRLRIGDHRLLAIVTIRARHIEVHDVLHRSVAYR